MWSGQWPVQDKKANTRRCTGNPADDHWDRVCRHSLSKLLVFGLKTSRIIRPMTSQYHCSSVGISRGISLMHWTLHQNPFVHWSPRSYGNNLFMGELSLQRRNNTIQRICGNFGIKCLSPTRLFLVVSPCKFHTNSPRHHFCNHSL